MMKRLNKQFRFWLIISILIWSACSGDGSVNKENQTPPPSPQSKTVFVLFDISDSTKAEETRRKYLDGFDKIIEKIGGGDVLVADFISDDPLGQSSFTINQAFPVFKTDTDNELLIKKQKLKFEEEIKTLREQAKEKAKQMLAGANRTVKKTKILDANLLAEKVFQKYQRPKNVLVIFSDMKESSEKIDFEKQKMSAETTKKILEDEKKASRTPKLSNVQVYVVGASGGNTLDSFNQIQNFWLEYYKAAGANLSKENYGAALLKFDE